MNGRILWPVVLAVVILGATITAAAAEKAAPSTAGGRTTALLTNAGIRISPRSPASGLTTFIVINRTNRNRGMVIYSKDPGGTPAFRYSPLIRPGGSLKLNFWLFPGRAYYFKDYTHTRVYGTQRRFLSQHRTVIRLPGTGGFGRGPRIARNVGSMTVVDNDIKIVKVSPGPNKLRATNKSSKTRGIVVTGRDIVGTPITSYSRRLKPGQSTVMNVWLYGGRTYTIRDYTACTVVPGKGVTFEGELSKTIDVPEKVAAAK